MQSQGSGPVELDDLGRTQAFRGVRELFIANATAPVRAVALVSDFEELVTVGPDTIVLLSPVVARGGWMISAALRYAWERRACALLVPERSVSETVIELARRLGVTLLASERDMTSLALDIAIHLGITRAGSLASLQDLTKQLAQCAEVGEALRLISKELDGHDVTLDAGGMPSPTNARAAGENGEAPTRPAELSTSANEYRMVAVPLSSSVTSRADHPSAPSLAQGSEDAHPETLVATVPHSLMQFAEEVLSSAAPIMRALLAETRLRALRDSLPLLSVASLVATDSAAVPARSPLWQAAGSPNLEHSVRDGKAYVAVFLTARRVEHAGALILQIWEAAFAGLPLARLDDGWLGFVPVSSDSERDAAIVKLRDRTVMGRSLELRLGVSGVREHRELALAAAREAWLAATFAMRERELNEPLVEFEAVAAKLAPGLMPLEFAHQLALAIYPAILAEPSGEDLARAVVAYLSHQGSSAAAAASLGVHRNTLQTRLRRAATLGVRLERADEVLSTHLLFRTLLDAEGVWQVSS